MPVSGHSLIKIIQTNMSYTIYMQESDRETEREKDREGEREGERERERERERE